MSNVPGWWEFVLLALASYRIWRLIALDTITEPLRRRVTRLGDWVDPETVPIEYRGKLADFLTCPWCMGWWVTLTWWLLWLVWPHATLVAAALFALSAVVGLVAKLDD